jgi:hypothetical protein
VAEIANILIPSQIGHTSDSPISFFTITKDGGTAKEREEELEDLQRRLESRDPVAVILIDAGEWSNRRDYEAAVRAWGATHAELPILVVQTEQIRAGGPNASLDFSVVELRRISHAPALGLANRLLQQTAIRGELWKNTANYLRYVALIGLACSILLGATTAGFISFVGTEQARNADNIQSVLIYQNALSYPTSNHVAALKTAQEYRTNPSVHAVNLLQTAAEALQTALLTAHRRQSDDSNVVFLSVGASPDSVKIVEVARAPADNIVRHTFSYATTSDWLDGIGPCAIATRHAIYWKGISQPGRFKTDSIAAWEASGNGAGNYDANAHSIRVAGRSCEYKRLPPDIPDNDRRELLCIPVGTNSNANLEPLGAICISSNEARSWLVAPWVRNAVTTAGIWLAPIDWRSAANAKSGGSAMSSSPPPRR